MTTAAAARDGDRRPVAAIFDLDRTITRHGTFTPFLWSVACRRPGKFARLPAIALAALGYRLGAIDRKRLKEVMLGAMLGGAGRAAVDEYAARFGARLVPTGLRPAALAAIEARSASTRSSRPDPIGNRTAASRVGSRARTAAASPSSIGSAQSCRGFGRTTACSPIPITRAICRCCAGSTGQSWSRRRPSSDQSPRRKASRCAIGAAPCDPLSGRAAARNDWQSPTDHVCRRLRII